MVAALLGAHGEGLDLVAFTDDARDVGAAEGQNSFFSSRCIAFVMRRRNLLVFALAFLRAIRSARRRSISSWDISSVKFKGMSETRNDMSVREFLNATITKRCEADALAVRWFNLIRELPLKITSF